MTFSSLVGRTFATTKQGPRYGKRVERLIVHHCANTNSEAMVRYLSGSGGGTSASYCLTTKPELVGIVPEELRPWTSNAIVGGVNYDNDSNSVTVETVNLTGPPEWLVTDGQIELLAKLAADLCKRYGWGKLDRNRVVGHREVLPKGYTECPGPHLYAHLDAIVKRGNEILNPPPKPKPEPEPTLGELKMSFKSVLIGHRPDEAKDRLLVTALDFEDGQKTTEYPVTKSYGDSMGKILTEGGFFVITKGHYDTLLSDFTAAVEQKREHELAVARASAGK